jgi:putative serine protease PepD
VIGAALKSSGTSTEHVCATNSVANHALPSVVTISATGPSGSGTGSGEVIRSDGYILTNNHVISVAANGGAVRVLFDDGVTEDATITGRDPQTDLAVLKVPASEHLQVIPIGSSASLKIGQPVVALGAPLGLSSTVTSGIVSALDRTVQVPGDNDRHALLVSAVQTDAAINPGNSGGALVDCDARLIGVPTAGATVPNPAGPPSGGSIGLGFAIPVDLATTIADELIKTGTVTHAYFGIATVPISEAAAARSGFPQGLYVGSVDPTGPSAKAGIRASDVITTIDGQAATSNLQLEAITLTKKPGDTVKLGYVRNGQSAETTVTLGSQP